VADTPAPPFDPQRVFGELVKLLRLLHPGVDSARVVYSGDGVRGVLPVPLDAVAAFGTADEPPPVPLTEMDPADAVLKALATIAPGQWMPGKELAGMIGLTHGGGRFNRLIASLKDAKKIEGERPGFRLKSQAGDS
jgi:hypothetical protein